MGTTNLSVSVNECILAFRSHPVKTNPNRAEIDDESGVLFLLQTGRPYTTDDTTTMTTTTRFCTLVIVYKVSIYH